MKSKKFFLTYEDYEEKGITAKDLADQILADPELPELDEIIVGCFGAAYDNEDDCEMLLNRFIENKEKLSHVESFFIGDMDYEECEVSWIYQGNYAEFLRAFSGIKKLTVKGSNGLTFGKLNHDNLEHLEIICGGLPGNVIQELATSKLPKLKTLILYIGIEDYGFDGHIDDLKSLCSKSLFPELKHLGLTDSESQDGIVKIVLESNILQQLEVLQLSYGTLSDVGGQMLLDNVNRISHLKKLDLSYHYLSNEMMAKLQKLPIEVDLSDQNECGDDEYDLYPMLTE